MDYKQNNHHTNRAILLFSACVISVCGLLYELLIASLSVSLKGNSILQYSLAIGVFMSALGIGSFMSRFFRGELVYRFVLIESILGIVGGLSVAFLNFVYVEFVDVYQIMSIVLLAGIGVCVGVEIPLITFIIQKSSDAQRSISNVLTFDYIGGLIGSLMFPLFLYPYLGLTKTAFCVGLMNLGIGIVNFVIFFKSFNKRQRVLIGVLNVSGIVILICGLVFSSALSGYYSRRIFGHVLYNERSLYQRILLAQKNGNTRLFLDQYMQFSSQHEHRYHEALVYPAFYCSSDIKRVLVLGGGDGLAVREILKFEGVKEVVLVDIDPKVTELAHSFPVLRMLNKDSLHDKRVMIINQDAYEYLLTKRKSFDVIYADFPDPHSPELAKLYSYEFFKLIYSQLNTRGVFITQSSSPYHANAVFWSIHKTLQLTFDKAVPYHVNVPDFGDWGFIMALKDKTMWPSNFDLPNMIKDSELLQFFSSEVFKASLIFSPDIQEKTDTSINYLNEPVLFRYYLESWQTFR